MAARRTTFVGIQAIAATLACLALVSCSKPQADALCPGCNVVLVSLDTVRADHLGAYGYDRDTSPNFDRLAARSLVFDDAISQAAWTLPAHGSMMSGLYPDELGVTHYPALRRLPDVNPTLAERFSAAGYATAGFVGGGFVSKHFGFDRGFDEFHELWQEIGSRAAFDQGDGAAPGLRGVDLVATHLQQAGEIAADCLGIVYDELAAGS